MSAAAAASQAGEAIRLRFAADWGRMGRAWGVAPSTASVHGYLLAHGGPLTESELQRALGISHRATRIAIAECEAWGIIERARELRRGGARGPAGTAWLPVEDHWEWFRRVVAARKRREGDPVLRVLREAVEAAEKVAAEDPAAVPLRDRLERLVRFTRHFEGSVDVLVRADARTLEKAFAVLGRLDRRTQDRILGTLAGLSEDDLVRAAQRLSSLSSRMVSALIRLVAQPRLVRLLDRAAPSTRDPGDSTSPERRG